MDLSPFVFIDRVENGPVPFCPFVSHVGLRVHHVAQNGVERLHGSEWGIGWTPQDSSPSTSARMVSPGGGGWSTRRGPLRQRCHGAPERGPVRDTPNGSTGARFWPASAVFTSAVWHSCRVQSVKGATGSRERGSGASRAVETEQAPGCSCARESWLTMKLTLTDDAMGACIAARGSEPTRSRGGMHL